MMSKKLRYALIVALAALPFASSAQEAVAEEEASSPWSASLAVTTDYVWRGVSQTDGDPAFQAGLTYTTPIGIYVGVWGSNIEFGSDADYEVDGFVGYNVDFGEKVNFDVNLTRYAYPNEGALNWNELITKTTFLEHYSLTVAYSDDTWATDESGLYYALGTSWELPAGFGIAAGVGRSDFSSDAGIDDYTDYNVGLSKSFGPATASVTYYSSDNNGKDQFFGPSGDESADGRVVFAVTVALP
jgi:uncharacterized protein (TIGR02001 family)